MVAVRNRRSIPRSEKKPQCFDRDLFSELIRLHVLHDAAKEPIFGSGMFEELAGHVYRISPGSLYAPLHGLENKGYLRSQKQRQGKSLRKIYGATLFGRKALTAPRRKVRELFHTNGGTDEIREGNALRTI